MNNTLQKKRPNSLKEKTQYGLTFGVIAMMLFVAGFPMVVIFFFGVFAYFLWKTFSSSPQNGVRKIFEFYLSANAILRDDERRWFGFEVQEVISRGEGVLRDMHGAPPLVYFALGALYNKIGNHENAVRHLTYVVEDGNADESSYVHPSVDLRRYVKVLRKIEQEPKDSPQTSAAVRSLERARKNRAARLLEESRKKITEESLERNEIAQNHEGSREAIAAAISEDILLRTVNRPKRKPGTNATSFDDNPKQVKRKSPPPHAKKQDHHEDKMYAKRKPITEVLHDIYDKNVQ